MENNQAIGVDIGGSHITSAVINLTNGQILEGSQNRLHVNALSEPENIISVWSQCIKASIELIGTERVIGIGIAMPGPFDYNLGISFIKDQNKYDSLYGLNVKDLLSKTLSLNASQFRFLNDAACFLKGEVFSGAAAGCKSAIGFTLGTGLGSAYYFEGKAEDANLWCSKFREGIAEDFISARWFVKRYEELSGRRVNDVKQLAELVSADKTAQMVFSEFANTLSEFMQPIIKEKQPEYVVIGGNIANAWNLFVEKLEQDLKKELLVTKIVKAQLAEEAALIGAASLFSNS